MWTDPTYVGGRISTYMEAGLPARGSLFGERYRIERAIGRGGFGCVYLAHDGKLERPVALKVAWPEPGSDDRLKRFLREAELSRGLSHPHTVRVYDVGSDPLPFIAFELLDGESLARRLSRLGALGAEETRRIAASVLKSLMEAHALGIVHRDVKPANVFLCRYAGETDFVKVLDFGIAKAPRRTELTAHGWLVGTPQYMAPEQITGADLTPRADLYSLGLVMAMMLSGEPLVSGGTAEVIADQLSDAPLALPPAVLQSPLAAVLRRAVEKDPARRFSSAAEMLGELEGAHPVAPTLSCTMAELRKSAPPASVSPVAYAVAPSTPPAPKPRSSALPWLAASALALSLCTIVAAGVVLALLDEPPMLGAELAARDPATALPLVRVRAEASNFRLFGDRARPADGVELSFDHPEGVGVLRLGSGTTESRANAACVHRGSAELCLWAAPRGSAEFDPALARGLLRKLVSP